MTYHCDYNFEMEDLYFLQDKGSTKTRCERLVQVLECLLSKMQSCFYSQVGFFKLVKHLIWRVEP